MAALSDLQVRQVGLECPKPDQLGTSFSGLTNPERDVQTEAGRDALMQNMAGPMAEAIAAIEQQLKELPAGDPSRPQLEDALKQLKAQQAAPQAPRPPSLTQAAALANLRKALTAVSGPGSVRLMETQPEYREAGNASRSAVLAAVMGKPQLALGLLLRAQALEPRNPAHLVNLAGIANYYGLFAEALALTTAAERLNPPAALRPLLLNNKGHALMRLRRLPEAEAALRAAAQADPNLQEARVNLAYTLGAQNKCAEAGAWAHRAWWRHNLVGAENLGRVRARPLTEAFTPVTAAPTLPALIFVQPGQTAGASEALEALRQEIEARRPKLEEFQAAGRAQSRRQVEIASERRVGAVKAKFVTFLADALNSATRLNDLNDYALAQGAALEAAQASLDRTVSELNARYGANPSCASATAWREAALPAFQTADRALRTLYAEAWRASATLATRFSEPTYRATAALRLRGLYYGAAQKVYENGRMYLLGLELARGSENCGGGSAAIVGALASPQVPPTCTPTAPPAVPARGWRLALSCDRTDFNFANPPWMNRYQILRDSLSPLVFSQLDSRLAVFVPGGFVHLTSEAAVMDAGLVAPGGNRDWSFVWNAGSGSVGFASSEPQFGVK
jgi:tetratricopeptide (TPR) repeat protein